MDFVAINTLVFTVDNVKFNRVMHAVEIKGGLLRINYISDGRLFRKVAISDVTINGQPLRAVSELNEVIYNYSCVCDLYGVVRHRIFDYTFDASFE